MLIESGATSFEYGKMDTPVFTQLLELLMLGERVFFAMFQYEPAIFYKYIRIQHKFRKRGNDIEIIWRVRKNQIVTAPASPEVFGHVRSDDPDIFYPELPGCTLEK